MEIIRICIIGAGNISNTRHIPAILKNSSFKIIGTISNDKDKITQINKKYNISKSFSIDTKTDIIEQLENCDWFVNEVDAVIIGTPPMHHYNMVRACLLMNKNVLVEKPMMMNIEECDEVSGIARQKNLVLYVMHSFQFANGIIQMEKRFQDGEFGKLESILEIQLSNRNRRLPKWYDELPLGLFYDEAAHFFYTAIRFGGGLKILNANAVMNKGENTPRILQAQMIAGETPLQMIMNFNSPICEWFFLLICEKKIAIYDYFKDILIVLDNDNMHYAKDILRLSLQFTLKYWIGFIANGFRLITKNLLYGHDQAIVAFQHAICNGDIEPKLSAELGRDIVEAMNRVVALVKEGK